MLTRYEFLPFDIGRSLKDPQAQVIIKTVCQDFGWESILDGFPPTDLKNIVPNSVGIFKKGSCMLYIPLSGYCVLRLTELQTKPTLIEEVAATLLNRVDFQQSIEKGKIPPSIKEAIPTLEALRDRLKKRPAYRWRLDPRAEFFTYSLSVFVGSSDMNPRVVQALLDPQSVGCSIATPSESLPRAEDVRAKILQLDPTISKNESETSLGKLSSNWSGVVLMPTGGEALTLLATLCEFRIQSSWLAAFSIGQLAANLDYEPFKAQASLRFELAALEFKQIASKVGQRLGANAPRDATTVAEEIIRSSDLLAEIERAQQSIEHAKERIEFATARHNAKGKRLLEICGVIFAASGLAQLLIDLPLSAGTVRNELPQLLLWILITFIGIVVVQRQRF